MQKKMENDAGSKNRLVGVIPIQNLYIYIYIYI